MKTGPQTLSRLSSFAVKKYCLHYRVITHPSILLLVYNNNYCTFHYVLFSYSNKLKSHLGTSCFYSALYMGMIENVTNLLSGCGTAGRRIIRWQRTRRRIQRRRIVSVDESSVQRRTFADEYRGYPGEDGNVLHMNNGPYI